MLQRSETLSQLQEKRGQSFLNRIGMDTTFIKSKDYHQIEVNEMKGDIATPICKIDLPNFGE